MGKLADEIRAKRAAENRLAYYKQLIAQGKVERAEAYKKTYSIVVPVEEPVPVPEAHVELAKYSDAAPAPEVNLDVPPPVPVETETHINGWPKKSLAKVWRILPNPTLIAVKLIGDERIVSMWNVRGATWRINSTVRVEIEKTEGDPIYKFVKQREDEVPLDRGAVMELSGEAVPEQVSPPEMVTGTAAIEADTASPESIDALVLTTPPSPAHVTESQPE
jgi:hypothetical protein